MAVHDYAQGDGPGGFHGLRVVRYIDGEARQRYFSFRDNGRCLTRREQSQRWRDAEALDETWRAEADAARRGRRPSATAVQGISALCDVSRHVDRTGIERTYYRPVFRVQVQGKSGWTSRSFPVLRDGLERAWAEAVECYARARGLRRLQPDAAQFRHVRRYMRRRGHSVPASRVPPAA